MATLQELQVQLATAPGVIGASVQAEPQALFAGLRKARIAYVAVVDGIAHAQAADAIVANLGEQNEAAYWLSRIPQPLVDNTVTYFAARTASTITAAQIQTFANQAWKSQANHASAGDIRNFRVDPVDGKTVQVTGVFNIVPASGAPTWGQQTWLLRLVDPDGSVTLGNANIKFERVV